MVTRRKNGGRDGGSPQELEAVTEVASCRHFRPRRTASHKEGWAARQPVDLAISREKQL